jgi:hypothetical protein
MMAENIKMKNELHERVKKDQEARDARLKNDSPETAQNMAFVDRTNYAFVAEIIHKYGWPEKELIGEQGQNDLWLLVQHQDAHTDLQEGALKKLEEAVKAGKGSPIHLAYLTDRVRVNKNLPQIYGTQWKQADGKYMRQPIENPKKVDELRKKMGLVTLEEDRVNFRSIMRLNDDNISSS